MMTKKSAFGLLGIAFGLTLMVSPAFAGPDRDIDRLSRLKTLAGEPLRAEDGTDYMPAAGAPALPPQPSDAGASPAPAPDPGASAPAPAPAPEPAPAPAPSSGGKLYYVTVPRDEVGNLMDLCQKHGVTARQYYNFSKLLLLKRSGFIVDVSSAKKSFVAALKREWTALPIKSVQFKVRVTSGFRTEEGVKVGTFGDIDGLLAPVVKAPYGPRTKVFRTIAQNFPGLLEKLDEVDKQYFGLGKKRLFLHAPRVTFTVTGLSINGKNKNGLLFSETYQYGTIKHAPGYHWDGRK